GPMSTSELRRTIEGPSGRVGLEVEPELVDTLVDDVAGEPGGLPLLSTALVDLWEARDGRRLTLAAYARSGGVRGAVARHAEAGGLYRGARLGAAVEWAESAGAGTLNRLERDFLQESRRSSVRANRRLRMLLAAALVLLIAAMAAGGVALAARSSADHQATSATAGRLGAQALIQPPLDLSLLLARAAVNIDDSLATRGYLLAALLRAPAAIAIAHAGGGSVFDEALSPDGRTLAVRGDDGNVVVVNAR